MNRRAWLFALAAGGGLAGCSGNRGHGDRDDETPAEAPTETTAPPTPTASASDLKLDGELVVEGESRETSFHVDADVRNPTARTITADLNAAVFEREAVRSLERWTREYLRTATTRARRLGLLGGDALLLALYIPTTTVIGTALLDAVVWALLVEVVASSAVYYLLRAAEAPTDVLEDDLAGTNLLGAPLLVMLAVAATKSRPGRTVWRFAFKKAAYSPGAPTAGPRRGPAGRYLGTARRRRRRGHPPRLRALVPHDPHCAGTGPVHAPRGGVDRRGLERRSAGGPLDDRSRRVLRFLLFVGLLVAVTLSVRQ